MKRAVAILAVLMLLPAAGAGAAYDPVGGGLDPTICEPPTLATSGERFVFTTSLRTGTRLRALTKLATRLNKKLRPSSGSRIIAVTGAQLALDPQTAQVLNEVFTAPQGQADPFAAGEPVATVSFSAQAQ